MTFGQLDVARRGAQLFDKVIVAVGENPKKRYLLPLERRIELIEQVTADIPNITAQSFQGLLVNYCRDVSATVILRGLRAVSDFEFELQIGLANRDMDPDIEPVVLLTEPRNIFISSSLIKEIASNGGDIHRYVPPEVEVAVLKALGGE